MAEGTGRCARDEGRAGATATAEQHKGRAGMATRLYKSRLPGRYGAGLLGLCPEPRPHAIPMPAAALVLYIDHLPKSNTPYSRTEEEATFF
jgi:hypothetical protein